MSTEPESLILQMLRQMRAEIGDVRFGVSAVEDKMATKTDLRTEIHSLRADLASDMIVNRKEMTEQVAGPTSGGRRIPTSVIGHGILISELEARVRRVEQHLNLPSIDH